MVFPLIAAALGLAEFAPVITRWLGGTQAEKVAKQVVEIAQKVTKSKDPLESIKLLHDNVLLVAEFQREVLRIESEWNVLLLQDRGKARERDVALANAGRKNIRADVMVLAAALGLCICLFTLTWYAKNLPGEAVGIISTVAGIFGSCLKDAYAFEFGSSRGSKEKDLTVAGLLQNTNSSSF